VSPRITSVIRVAFLIGLSGLGALRSCCLIEQAETQIVETVPRLPASEKAPPDKETAGELLRQSTEFQGWAVLILGGITAVLVTTKVHSNSSPEWTFILFGPSMVFLSYSFLAAWELKKRYNYLLLHNNFADVFSLARYLQVQFQLFGWSIGILTLFSACFLSLILVRRIKPDQTPNP
jgi:hypothetical protein